MDQRQLRSGIHSLDLPDGLRNGPDEQRDTRQWHHHARDVPTSIVVVMGALVVALSLSIFFGLP
jgi:hypothetical protein